MLRLALNIWCTLFRAPTFKLVLNIWCALNRVPTVMEEQISQLKQIIKYLVNWHGLQVYKDECLRSVILRKVPTFFKSQNASNDKRV